MTGITKAQLADAMLFWQQVIDDAPRRKAAEERYLATVKECNFSDCPHFDMDTRHCARKICCYDLRENTVNFDNFDDDEWEDWSDFEWEE